MFAIVEIGGKQYKVKEKDVLRVEKLSAKENESLTVDKVLLVSNGKETRVGAPFVASANVGFKVLGSGLGKKDIIFKMKAKKRYKRLRGHRQPFSEVEVVKIGWIIKSNGKS